MRRANAKEVYKSHEANCSPNFYKWQVINFRQENPEEVSKLIYSGDVIRLKHAETNGFLCFDEISINRTNKKCYVRIYKGNDEDDKITTNNLFEIEAHNELKVENESLGA